MSHDIEVTVKQNKVSAIVGESTPVITSRHETINPVPSDSIKNENLSVELVGNQNLPFVDIIGITSPPASDPTQTNYTAGENISADTIVYLHDDGMIYTASADDILACNRVVGITTAAINSGNLGAVQYRGLRDGPWSWTPNKNLFLDLNGQLTETQPNRTDHLFVLMFADSISPTKINIQIKEALVFA